MKGRKPVTQCSLSEWRGICQHLRACVQPPEGYTWRLVWSAKLSRPDSEHFGFVIKRGKDKRGRGTVTVVIARGMSQSETEDTLLHEVAHVFDMWEHHHGWGGEHSDTFWLWLGRVYRRYHGLETG